MDLNGVLDEYRRERNGKSKQEHKLGADLGV